MNAVPTTDFEGDREEELALSDRRQSERRPPVIEPTFVWISFDDRIQTRMLDQSEGGLSVVVSKKACRFEEGFQVRVEIADECRMANIVYVGDFDETRVRVGLAWEPPESRKYQQKGHS